MNPGKVPQQPTNTNGSGNIRSERSESSGRGSGQSSSSAGGFGGSVFNPSVGFGPMDLAQYNGPNSNNNPMSGSQSMFNQGGPGGSPFLNQTNNPFWTPNQPPNMPPPGGHLQGGPGQIRGQLRMPPNQMNRMLGPRNQPSDNNMQPRHGGGWNR